MSECWFDSPTTINCDNAWGTNLLNDQSTRVVHGKRSNFAFVDGHIQNLLIPGTKTFSEVQWAGDTMWLPFNSTASNKMK
jgi:prepilin-type processing-associated H-X9-DG protein